MSKMSKNSASSSNWSSTPVSYANSGHERPESRLCQMQIDDVMRMNRVFGTKTPSGETPVVLIPDRSCLSIFMSVPDGCYSLVSKNGKILGQFKPGGYFLGPWYKVSHLVTTNSIAYHMHVKEATTADNVQIKVYIDILFQVTDPIKFVIETSPEKFEELLKATQAESIRSMVREVKVANAYNLRGHSSEEMLRSLNAKTHPFGVNVSQINITNVALPETIANALQHETTFSSLQAEQKKRQEYDLRVLNDGNYLQHLEQDRRNERLRVEELAKRNRANVERECQQIEAEVKKQIAEIQADQKAEMTKVKAEMDLEIGKVRAQTDLEVAQIESKGKAEVARIKAEAEKYVATVSSNAVAQAAKNRAEAFNAESGAQKEAATKLRARREFEINMSKLQVLRGLGRNDNAIMIAESAESNPIGQLMIMQSGMQMVQKMASSVSAPSS